MGKLAIINDETKERDLYHPHFGTGLDLESRPRGMAYGGLAQPFPKELLVPRGEWQARAEELAEQESGLDHLALRKGCQVKSQDQTLYCWVNSPTFAAMVLRVAQNLKNLSLSPASAGGPITGFRNQGGWGRAALEYIIKNGLVPSSVWPDNAIDPRYNTPSNRKLALSYRFDEWWELEPGNLDQQISALFRRIPVSVGLNYWGHQVTDMRPVWMDGEIAVLFANSWGLGYGDRGYGVRQGRRMLADDAVAPRTAIAA